MPPCIEEDEAINYKNKLDLLRVAESLELS